MRFKCRGDPLRSPPFATIFAISPQYLPFMVQKWHHPAWRKTNRHRTTPQKSQQTHPRRGDPCGRPICNDIHPICHHTPQNGKNSGKYGVSWRNWGKTTWRMGRPQGIAPTVRTLYGKIQKKWQKTQKTVPTPKIFSIFTSYDPFSQNNPPR